MTVLKRLGTLIFGFSAVYLLLPAILFDFGKSAYCVDEDNTDTKRVVVGPRPRWILHPLSPNQAARDGTQMIVRVYPWVCRWYADQHGYDLSRFQRDGD